MIKIVQKITSIALLYYYGPCVANALRLVPAAGLYVALTSAPHRILFSVLL